MFTSALVISGFPGILTGNSTSVVVPILSLTSFDQRMVFIGCPLCLRGEGMHRLVRDVGGADQSLPDLSASCSDPTGELLALGVSCLGIAKDTLVYLRLLQLELGIRSHSTVLELLLSTL